MQRHVGVVAAVLVLTGTAAYADPRADKLFTEGRALINKGDAKGACDKFAEAYKIDPTAPGIMLNLGLCNQMLGKLGTSLRWFRKAQAASAEAKADDFKAEAEKRTVEIAPKVSTLKIDASTAPAGVEVRVDGELIDQKDFPLYEIDDGDHKLEARAPGKSPFRQDLKVGNHEQQTITLAFTDALPPVVIDRGKTRRRIAYGLGILGVGLETAMLFYNLDRKDLGEKNPQDAQQYKDDIRVKGTAMFVAGIAALGTGVYLYITAPGKETVERSARIAPVVGRDQAGFAISGRF